MCSSNTIVGSSYPMRTEPEGLLTSRMTPFMDFHGYRMLWWLFGPHLQLLLGLGGKPI